MKLVKYSLSNEIFTPCIVNLMSCNSRAYWHFEISFSLGWQGVSEESDCITGHVSDVLIIQYCSNLGCCTSFECQFMLLILNIGHYLLSHLQDKGRQKNCKSIYFIQPTNKEVYFIFLDISFYVRSQSFTDDHFCRGLKLSYFVYFIR